MTYLIALLIHLGETFNYVGGICGETWDYSSFKNCTNSGYIKGVNYVGGICGYAFWTTFDSSCSNTGTIEGTGSRVGNIYGDNDD